MKKPILNRSIAATSVAILSVLGQVGCGLAHRHTANANLPGPVAAADQPDKILYQRAVTEIQHGRYDVGRLTLQTLLNTYPDSEFLAKAKLAIADSYYNEGGVAGLTQSESEYKDFITFFPTAPEAPQAQLRVGMAHFRLMGKPDRDRTEARLAEVEFKEFLLKYPDSKLMPRAKARLREIQEVLGESNYRIAEYYYLKQANRAARSRFQEIADNYPNYSKADSALWYLGQTYERLKQPKEAATYYSALITDHPLSTDVPSAKARLTALHQPIPRPTRAMIARAQADASHQHRQTFMSKVTGVLGSSPDVSATRHGPVKLGGSSSGTVMAKTSTPSNTGNAIAVEQVGDNALNSGKTAEAKSENSGKPAEASSEGTSKPAETNSGSPDPAVKTNSTPADPGKSASDATAKDKPSPTQAASSKTDKADKSEPTDVPPPKKKGKFHFLKKVIP